MTRRSRIPTPWQQGHWWLLALLALFVLLVAVAYWRSAASDTGLATLAQPTDLITLLAPFLVIATAIERFWEAVFSMYERVALAAGRVMGIAAHTAKWMNTELRNAEQAVTEAVSELGDHSLADPEYLALWASFQEAEQRLLDAQARIAETLKTPEYVAAKRAITVAGSLVIGLLVSVGANLALFQVAGFALPRAFDVLLTGILIGAGPGPLHIFIGVLHELRATLAGLANLAQGSAYKRVEEALTPRPQVIVRSAAPAAPATPPEALLQGLLEQPTDGRAAIGARARGDLRVQRQVQRILRLR